MLLIMILLASTTVDADVTNPSITTSTAQLSEQEQLWRVVERINSEVHELLGPVDNDSKVKALLASDCEGVAEPGVTRSEYLLAEAEALEKDKGLDIRGGYTIGDQSGGVDDEDGDAYLELNWNVLRGGYKAKKDKALAVRNHAEAARINAEIQRTKRAAQCRKLSITNSFTSLRLVLLKNKLELMRPVYDIERRAYFKGWSFLDELLVSESDLHNASKAVERLNHPELVGIGDIARAIEDYPIIDIDLAGVIRAIQTDERSKDLHEAKRMATLYDARSKEEDDSLRFYVRKNFIDNGNGLEDDGMVAGMRFIIPLSGKNLSPDHRVKEIHDEYEVDSWRRVARTRMAFVELHEQQERVVEQHFRFLRSSERLRRSIVSRDVLLEEADLATAIVRTRSMLDASLELLKSKEELYQRVNEIFHISQVEFNPVYIRKVDLPGNDYRSRMAHRSLYMWSSSINGLPPKRIWQFAEAKGIKRLILSAGRKTDTHKLDNIIKQARSKNIDVELMVGSNEWYLEKNHSKAAARVARMSELTGHMHLDIEPHTLPGYKQNRRKYIDLYIELIMAVRNKMEPEDKLTLSLPVHWDIKDYKKLASLADDIFLMSYEMKSFERIEKRLAPIMEVMPVDRVTIALRPQDFTDEWDMEKVINKLVSRFRVRRVALHDAKSYMSSWQLKK